MNKNYPVVLFALLLAWPGAMAQRADSLAQARKKPLAPITTDRPDQTESPILVPVGYLQIETGFMLELQNHDGISERNLSYHSTLLKYGMSKNIEFRLINEYIGHRQSGGDNQGGVRMNGFSPVTLGTKLYICEEKGWLPKTSLIAHIDLPYFGRQEFRPSFVAPSFRFTMQHTLSDRFSMGYNLGAEWDGESPNAEGIYTLTSGMSLCRQMSMYVELYGFLREKETAAHRFNSGFTFLLSDHLQLDASGGFGLSRNAHHSFASTGISWRFNTRPHALQPAGRPLPANSRTF